MKILPASLAMLASLLPLAGQDAAPKWDVEIPKPVLPVAEERITKPEPVEFNVLDERTIRMDVSKAPEMHDLPPITGTINVTVQEVADPGLPDPPPPLPALPPNDPAVLARMKELRETYRGTELVFLSATVHSESAEAKEARTLLRIYPNGDVGKEVVAWSNLNFLHLTGHGGYRVNLADGTSQDYGILMGISPTYGQTMRRMAARIDREYEEPEIPKLPDLATSGPTFVIVEGDDESPAMDVLEQLHDLFRKSGETMKEQYFAREKARAIRKAFLLANPPKPADVTIQFWKRNNSSPQTAQP